MADFVLGRLKFKFKGTWAASTAYIKDDVVFIGGKSYCCITNHTSTTNFNTDSAANWSEMVGGYDYSGNWAATTTYHPGTVVKFGPNLYICAVGHTSTSDFPTDLAGSNWTLFIPGMEYAGEWTPATEYKLSQLIKFGPSIYTCTTTHTSSTSFDATKFSELVGGFQYKLAWNTSSEYAKGDVVLYGGHTYVANIKNSSIVPGVGSEWDLLVKGVDFQGEHNLASAYRVGQVVRYGGFLYLCNADTTALAESSSPSYTQSGNKWNKYMEGITFLTTGWHNENSVLSATVTNGGSGYTSAPTVAFSAPPDNTGTTATGTAQFSNGAVTAIDITDPGSKYAEGTAPTITITGGGGANAAATAVIGGPQFSAGEAIRYTSTTYMCILEHRADTAKRPDNDNGTYWTTVAEGDTNATMTRRGDLVTRNSIQPTRISRGAQGQALFSDDLDLIWKYPNETPNVTWVATNGVDDNDPGRGKSQERPYASVKFACDNTSPDWANGEYALIKVTSGKYQETLPITVQKGCSLVGDELRQSIIEPKAGYETGYDMFRFNDSTILRGFTLQGMIGTLPTTVNSYGTKRPTGGSYCTLDPGTGPTDDSVWITKKSPYLQGNTLFGTSTVGMKVDGSIHNGGYRSMCANDFTQVHDNGIGVWVKDLARVEIVSVFSYYAYIGYLGENGGIIRATNGNSSYGTYGTVAEGVNVTEVSRTATVNNRKLEAAAYVVPGALNSNAGIKGVSHLEYVNAGTAYTIHDVLWSNSGAVTNGQILWHNNNMYTVVGAGALGSTGPTHITGTETNGAVDLTWRETIFDWTGSGNNDINGIPTIANDAVSEVRILTRGGVYVSSTNNAQSGELVAAGPFDAGYYKAELAQAETALTDAYKGMRIHIIDGLGAGWYGFIDSPTDRDGLQNASTYVPAYDAGTKIAYIFRESDSVKGWESMNASHTAGNAPDGVLDTTSRYTIEPRPTVSTGTGATATAVVTTGIDAVTMSDAGGYYNAKPTVKHTVNDTAAAANAGTSISYVSGPLGHIEITNRGSGYTSAPTIAITGGGSMTTGENTTCERDVGYGIESANYDMAIGTNYMAITTGQRMHFSVNSLGADRDKVLAAIFDARTNHLAVTEVDADATAKSRVAEAWDATIRIMEKTKDDHATITWPAFGASNAEQDGAEILRRNADFLAAEINAWVTQNYSSHQHDSTKCTRDTLYIVNALSYDLLYGGTKATTIMAKSFNDGGTFQLPAADRTVTAAAYAHIATVMSAHIQGNTVTATTGNTVSQDVSNGAQGGTGDATGAGEVDANMQIIEDVITAGNVSGLPAEVNPVITSAAAALQTAHAAVVTAKASIITNSMWSQATATATITGGIATATITTGGSYATLPEITVTGDGSDAVIVPTMTGTLNAITMSNNGANYTTVPTITFTGGDGVNALATAKLNASVTGITIVEGGNGYTDTNLFTATVGDPTGAGGTTATVTPVIDAGSGTIINFTIDQAGSGYELPPAIVVEPKGDVWEASQTYALNVYIWFGQNVYQVTTGGTSGIEAPDHLVGAETATQGTCEYTYVGTTGSGFYGSVSLLGTIASIAIDDGGTGYTAAPTVVITGGGGTSAAATATITNKITSLSVADPGHGYTNAALVFPAGNTQATGACTVTNMLDAITVSAGGNNYISNPVVEITGGGGTQSAGKAYVNGSVIETEITGRGVSLTNAPHLTYIGSNNVRTHYETAKFHTDSVNYFMDPVAGDASTSLTTITRAGAVMEAVVAGNSASPARQTGINIDVSAGSTVANAEVAVSFWTKVAKFVINNNGVFPDSISLINQNNAFITAEIKQYLTDQAVANTAAQVHADCQLLISGITTSLSTAGSINDLLATAATFVHKTHFITSDSASWANLEAQLISLFTGVLNQAGYTALQGGEAQVLDPTKAVEATGVSRVTDLVNLIDDAVRTKIATGHTSQNNADAKTRLLGNMEYIVAETVYDVQVSDMDRIVDHVALGKEIKKLIFAIAHDMEYFLSGSAVSSLSTTPTVSSITVTAPGSGYSTTSTVGIAAPTSGITARCTPVVNPQTGGITSLTVVEQGTGYDPNSLPTVTVSQGSGTAALLRSTVVGGYLSEMRVLKPGSGYTIAPFVGLTDPNNVEAGTLQSVVSDGVLGQPTFTAEADRGTGYATVAVTLTGTGYAESLQTGEFMYVEGFTDVPSPGSNLEFENNSGIYKLVSVRELTATNPDMVEAKNLIQLNKEYIKEEVNTFMVATYAAHMTANHQVKCKEDTGYLVDAYVKDFLTGDYQETIFAAQRFFTPNLIPSLQSNPTEYGAAYDKVKEICDKVALNITFTATQYDVLQYKSGYTFTDSASVLARITAIDGAHDFIITNGVNLFKAKELLAVNETFIKEEIAAYMAITYEDHSHDIEKCKRDVGFIVDAIAYDIFSGDARSREAGIRYYQGTLNYSGSISVAAKAGIQYVDTVAKAVLNNTDPAALFQSSVPRVSDGTYTALANTLAKVSSSITYVLSIIENGFASVTTTGQYSARIQVNPEFDMTDAPAHGIPVTVRALYSQVRLTGHDFLDIGTGGYADTNYPDQPVNQPSQPSEVLESGGGRAFYTSTDQDGNFRVGDLFEVEQATGIATLNAEAFNLSGLNELTLGGIGLGGASAVIKEFSTDGTFLANSDEIVPTQRAIRTYISAQLGSGGGNLQVNALTAGDVTITANTISTDQPTLGLTAATVTTSADLTVGGTFTESSALVYKMNVTPIASALETVLQLVGYNYDRRDSGRHETGLIAEQVDKHIPQAVTYKDGKPDGIQYTKLVGYLVESIKELKDEIDILKGKK